MSPAPPARRQIARAAALAVMILAAVLTTGLLDTPSAVAADAVQCLHQANAPAPPAGGAVFWAAENPNDSASVNVIVIPVGAAWTATGSCAATGRASAAALMTHPRTIAVGAGGAVLLQDQAHHLVSAWGAKTVAAGDPAPVLFPGRTDWTTTEADAVDPAYLLNVWNSCRDCALAKVQFDPVQVIDPQGIAYGGDVSGADLSQASLTGNFAGWVFDGTNLSDATVSQASLAGASLDHTTVSNTAFTDVDLRGAHLRALLYSNYPGSPRFSAVRVGLFNRACTTFADMNLLGVPFAPIGVGDPGCETSPLFPGTSIPTHLLYTLAVHDGAHVDWAGSEFVSGFDDRAELAGANLTGINLDGASFIGYPVDLSGAKFDGASLQHASFDLATLSGATFQNADGAGASFHAADLAALGSVTPAANFSGSKTNLEQANFVAANVSGAKFVGVDLQEADFSGALAADSDFTSVRAAGAAFTGAHIYGNGQAFENASNLTGADFSGAVLGGDTDESGGFNLTHTDLTGAKFDATQCISCNFSYSKLEHASFVRAYLPGATFASAVMTGAKLTDAWLYCGNQSNTACPSAGSQRWSWSLALGAGENYGPVPFAATNLTGVSLDDVGTCPSGKTGSASPAGCTGDQLLPDPDHAPIIPAGCSAAGPHACPTNTTTLFDSATIGLPLSITPASPRTWATKLSQPGDDVGYDDGTVRVIGNGTSRIVAGSPDRHCPSSTDACGDGGPATQALLGTPAGLAVGLDGSLYIADPVLHRVRRIDPSGQIATIAGDGQACTTASGGCGDNGPAGKASLAGPYGVAVTPDGQLYVADGTRGIRRVQDGNIYPVGASGYDVRSVVQVLNGDLYASTPDYLVKVAPLTGEVTRVVGTGTSGYNGNADPLTGTPLPGSQVQINHPAGLAVARNGNVIFADTDNNLIRAYVPSTGHVTAPLAGLVTNNTPQGGFNGDGLAASQTKLDHPRAVAVIADGLYAVADTGNRRVREIGPNPPPTTPTARHASIVCTVTISVAYTARVRRSPPQNPTRCVADERREGTPGQTGALVLATISRRHQTYAAGTQLASRPGHLRLALIPRRQLRPGRYTLTVDRRLHNHRTTKRQMTITILG